MKKVELVFIPLPGRGHLVSIVEFAKRLIVRDDRLSITILVMKPMFGPPLDAFTDSLSESGIQVVDLPQVDTPPLDPAKSIEHFVDLFIQSYKPIVKDKLSNLLSSRSASDSVRVAGLVLDLFCTPMIDVGNELGLPSYLFFTSGAGFLGFMFYLATRHGETSNGFAESDPELIMPSFANPVPPRVLPSAVFCEDGYAAFIKLARRFRDPKGIIVNTFSELEPHAVNSFSGGGNPPVYTVGPVLDLMGQGHPASSDHPQRETIMRWLDEQPPASVVFLCFGSMGSFSAPQLREIAIALELSQQRFLWSMRQPPPPERNFTVPTVCTKPEDVVPQGFLDRTAGRGLICGWAPQVEILAHKAIGGFVSHCGWNSVLESLWNGVPIVTWPIYAEQQFNAFNMSRELGLAVEMRLDYRRGGDVVMAAEIERAVRCVMDGEGEVRKKAQEMGEKGRKALMDGGSSSTSLGRLIEDLIGGE